MIAKASIAALVTLFVAHAAPASSAPGSSDPMPRQQFFLGSRGLRARLPIHNYSKRRRRRAGLPDSITPWTAEAYFF